MSRWVEMGVGILLIGAASLSASACRSAGAGPGQVATPAATSSQPAGGLEKSLQAYKSWRLVNPQPLKRERIAYGAVAGIMCRDPSAPDDNPHVDKYISVYVNEVGESAMMTEARPRFPPGSIIVKEKRDTEAAGTPVMTTVMVKHEKGYDEVVGDWEYLVMDGAATKVSKPARPESCQGCHAAYRHTDFVTRRYLTADARAKLR